MKAVIFNIQRYCLQDGPGIRTTVFFKGCPLHCLWCHNPESQSVDRQLMYYESKCTGCGQCLGKCEARQRDPERPQYILVDPKRCILCGKCIEACMYHANEFCGKESDTQEIFQEVLKDRAFYGTEGGMTLSGGEPAMQSAASLELLRLARENGISAVVETSGFGSDTFYEAARELDAIFYFDLKTLNPEKHRNLTGVPLEPILSNLKGLMEGESEIVLRLPMIPGCNDSDEELLLLAEFLKEHESRYRRAEILKYHNLGISKAKALSRAYEAPKENATAEQAARWMRLLKSRGAQNILFS